MQARIGTRIEQGNEVIVMPGSGRTALEAEPPLLRTATTALKVCPREMRAGTVTDSTTKDDGAVTWVALLELLAAAMAPPLALAPTAKDSSPAAV